LAGQETNWMKLFAPCLCISATLHCLIRARSSIRSKRFCHTVVTFRTLIFLTLFKIETLLQIVHSPGFVAMLAKQHRQSTPDSGRKTWFQKHGRHPKPRKTDLRIKCFRDLLVTRIPAMESQIIQSHPFVSNLYSLPWLL
jgi:hypothetical protein